MVIAQFEPKVIHCSIVAQMKPKLKVDNTFYYLTDTQAQIQADLSDTLPHACKNAVY